MPCYHPITAYKPRLGGKVLFDPNSEDSDEIQIPCGQCHGCRRKRARDWAIRCVHEARTHKHNCYITLTYNDENLPVGLQHRHFTKFINRLQVALNREINRREKQEPANSERAIRQRLGEATYLPSRPLAGSGGTGGRTKPRAFLYDASEISTAQPTRRQQHAARRLHISYYMCGEYGERNGRPHYHALLFGVDFADRRFHTIYKGNRIDTSKTLEDLWGMGFTSVGSATYESARYISEYILKKITGDKKTTYTTTDPTTGEIREVKKEYNAMSKRPGVGSGYLRKYGQYLTHGWVINNGHKFPPPRYYDNWIKKHLPDQWEDIQHKRYLLQLEQAEHHTPERLAVHEQVDRARIRNRKRG